MSLPLVLILATLACWRLTRLITLDDFPLIRKPRQAIIDLGWKRNPTSPFPPWYAELVGCSWCASFWIAGAGVKALTMFVSIPLPVLAWMAVWGGSCALHAVTDGRDK